MKATVEWKTQTRIIAKCTPSLGAVSLQWAKAVQGLLWPMATAETCLYLRDGPGGEIAETRNAIVDGALAADAVTPIWKLFWIDDDVIVQQGALIELLNQGVDICSGVYFTKREGNLSEPLIFTAGGVDKFRPDAIYDVAGHGMGLALISLDVYKRMRDELNLPPDKYGRPSWYHTSKKDEEYACDDKGIIDAGHTEDLYFLNNARKLGYQPRIVCTKHALGFHFQAEKRAAQVAKDTLRRLLQKAFELCNGGRQKISIAELADAALPQLNEHLKKLGPGQIVEMEQGYPTKQWEAWIAGEPIVWDTPDGPVIWD